MNENKSEVKGFFLYLDQLAPVAGFTDAQLGQLMRAMFAWHEGKDLAFDDPMVEFAFGFFRASFDRANRERLEHSRVQSERGKKGGRPRKEDLTSEKPPLFSESQAFSESQGFLEKPCLQKKPNSNSNYDSNSNTTPPTPPQGEAVVVSSECKPVSSVESTTPPTGKRRRKREGDAPSEYSPLFEEFWEAYPRRRRVNKFAAWKKFWAAQQAGILPDDIVQRVRNRQCEEDWAKEDGQYVPAPEVWLNKHGWEDEGCVWDPMGYKKLPQEIQDLMEEHYQWSRKLKSGIMQPGETREEFEERYDKWQRINLEYTERIRAMGVSSYEPLW